MGYVVNKVKRNKVVFLQKRDKILTSSTSDGTSHDISEVMCNGQWSGKKCFLLGGGPSLKGFDYNFLSGQLTIGINRTFEVFEPTLLYCMDARFYDWVVFGEPGKGVDLERKKRWNSLLSLKVFLGTKGKKYKEGVVTVRRRTEQTISLDLKKGIYGGTNSGFGALMLAIALGAKEIYLLGYDFKVEEKDTHWHNGYGWLSKKKQENVLKTYIKIFERFAPTIDRMGIKVINLNPDSALRCFRRESPNKVHNLTASEDFLKGFPLISITDIKPTMPVFVSFFTKGTWYEEEVIRLIRTLSKFGLDYDITSVQDKGSWSANVRYKPTILRKALDRYSPRPVVFLDADAEVVSYPKLFDGLDTDLAVHRVTWGDYKNSWLKKPQEVLSGTLFMRKTERIDKIIDEWKAQCTTKPLNIWEQKLLQSIIGDNFYQLPPEYCTIFDLMGRWIREPVIVHNQASRRYRSNKNRMKHVKRT